MTSENIPVERSNISLWIQAARPFVASASVIPVLVAAMCAIIYKPITGISWFLFPVILIAAVLFHIGGNLVSEYFDYKKTVDREDTFGSSRVLVEKLMQPNHVLTGGLLCFAIGFILGLILVFFRGLDIFYLGLGGLIAGVFYTIKPFQFKYNALGDLLIFFAFGPLLILGSFLGLTGMMNWEVVWISIPIGFLVVAILHANNTRDIRDDSRAKIKTQASVLGINGAKYEYYFLLIGSYIATIVLILFGIINWYALIVFISLPIAIKDIIEFSKATVDKPETIAMMDVKTAQLHMQFGLLYTIGLLLTGIL